MDAKPSWLRTNDTPPAPSSANDSVLFFCTANICRSAFAEQLFRDRLGTPVSSAGIHALVGHDMDPMMKAELTRRGLAVRPHRAQQLTGRMLAQATLAITFERAHLAWALSESPAASSNTVLIGQLTRYLEGLDAPQSWSQIAAGATRLQVQSEDVLDDPYGRGAGRIEGATERVERVVELLRQKTLR